jgi:hypothetical protein
MTRNPRAVRRASSAVVESIERRVMLDATYHVLSNGNFSQDWSNTSLITTNDDWSNVPSIIGYRGDDITTGIGIDPQTLTAFAGPGGPVVDVNANQTNPDTFATGGVTEFEIANPVVALNGSGTADAPFILLHLNTTGVSSVAISYLLRDIDASGDNAVQPVALQYRVGDSGPFTNVPEAFVADASAGPNLTLDTPVSVTLPAAAGNVPQLQVRIMTTNASGNDEHIGIDNIVVSNASAAAGNVSFVNPSISANESVGTVTLEVNRGGGSSGAVTVDYTTVNGSALAGADYTTTTGTLSWANGESGSKFIVVPILNDGVAEPTESFTVSLSNPTGGLTISGGTATVTIADDDSAAPVVVLNELLVDPPGTDTCEYIEIRGTPNGTLFGLYFLSIEGDGTGTGAADQAIDLSSFTLGSNGLLVIKSSGTPSHTFPTGTTIVTRPETTGLLENGSNSFALVYSPNTVIAQGLDLDLNNDGTIDNLPSGAVVIDAVGWKDGDGLTNNDKVYGVDLSRYDDPNAPTSIIFTPDAATRFPTDLTPNSAAAWYVGDILGGTPNGQLETQYDPAELSSNAPSGTPVITPGAANYPQPTALKGDMNGDNAVNNQDIAPFVLALTDYPQYQIVYPGLDGIFRGDINEDTVLNNQDIAPFVALLTGPRPASANPFASAPSKRLPVRVESGSGVLTAEPTSRITRGVFATSAPVLV